jgi:hypothetical protein
MAIKFPGGTIAGDFDMSVADLRAAAKLADMATSA